jgi:hypothetical protein
LLKTLTELKPKCCIGFDRVFLKESAFELREIITKLMLKILEEEKIPEK